MIKIFLPGGNKQLQLFIETAEIENKKILVVGTGNEIAAQKLAEISGNEVEMIVENYDSMMNAKIIIESDPRVNIKIMEFSVTDYSKDEFDLIYAQASVSTLERNKIIKELKRILKPGGVLSVGEVTSKAENPPVFILDIWDNSFLEPLLEDQLSGYYTERNFTILNEKDLSGTLKEYYSESLKKNQESVKDFSDQEKSYYKKLINKISHESKAYLRQGGDKYIGFKTLIMRKN